jgi:glycosyltransferase involved in cell wall biosynthesis
MRAGLPVIASDVGGVKEAVKDFETGFLIPRGNAEYLSERIKYYYLHPEDISTMGKQGYLFLKEHFTTEFMLEKILSVYQEIMEVKN